MAAPPRAHTTTPTTMHSPYDGWTNRCAIAAQDIRTIRKLLERLIIAIPNNDDEARFSAHRELREALECQERIRSLLFFADQMLPPTPAHDPDPEDVEEDEHGQKLSPVAPVVSPFIPVREVSADAALFKSTLADASARRESFLDLFRDVSGAATRRDERPSTGALKWLFEIPEEERVIAIPDIQRYRNDGLLEDHPEFREYIEEVQRYIVEPTVKADKTTPHFERVAMTCRLCVKLKEDGKIDKVPQPLQLNASPIPFWKDNSKTHCSLTTHITKYHQDLSKVPKKCGCNLLNLRYNRDGFTDFYTFKQHIQGIIGSRNLHREARKDGAVSFGDLGALRRYGNP